MKRIFTQLLFAIDDESLNQGNLSQSAFDVVKTIIINDIKQTPPKQQDYLEQYWEIDLILNSQTAEVFNKLTAQDKKAVEEFFDNWEIADKVDCNTFHFIFYPEKFRTAEPVIIISYPCE